MKSKYFESLSSRPHKVVREEWYFYSAESFERTPKDKKFSLSNPFSSFSIRERQVLSRALSDYILSFESSFGEDFSTANTLYAYLKQYDNK